MRRRILATIGLLALLGTGPGACAEPAGGLWGDGYRPGYHYYRDGPGHYGGYYPGRHHFLVPPPYWTQRRWAEERAWRHHAWERERWHDRHQAWRHDRHGAPRRENWSQDRLRRHWEEQFGRRF